MQIRLARETLQTDSIVDGDGIRSVLWTQGCPHHCLGCHNPETWGYESGALVDVEDIKKQLANLENKEGLTLTGGEPFAQVEALVSITKYAKDLGFNIWAYSGYTFEYLSSNTQTLKLLELVDVLVDGKFMLELKSAEVKFRGSTNQRIIDVAKSLKKNKAVEIKYETTKPNSKADNLIFI